MSNCVRLIVIIRYGCVEAKAYSLQYGAELSAQCDRPLLNKNLYVYHRGR